LEALEQVSTVVLAEKAAAVGKTGTAA